MLDKRTRCKIYLLLVEYTAIPLLLGLYLLYLSGYGLTTRRAEKLTLGLIDYRKSVILHTGILPYFVGILVVVHAVAGIGLMINRRVKNPTLRLFLELLNLILVGIAFLTQLTILELL